MLKAGHRQPQDLISLLPRTRRPLGSAFVVQLTQRLRDQDPAMMAVVEELEQRLKKEGLSLGKFIQEEHHRQAAAQVTVGNIITSMRLLSTLDWKDFFEKVSLIDPELKKDPAGIYARMDFTTRDRYRHVIERVSKGAKKSELEIAHRVLELAQAARAANEDAAHSHVGYFLIDRGITRLEQHVGYRAPLRDRVFRAIERHATIAYLGTMTLVTVLFVILLVVAMVYSGAGIAITIIAVVLALIPASDLI